MYNIFAYFDDQITNIINYLDRYSLFPHEFEILTLTEIKFKMAKLFECLKYFSEHDIFQINGIMKSAYDYLEVVNNSADKEEVRHEEKFRTIIDIHYELEKYINKIKK